MAERRSGGAGFGWFIVGFLTGVLAALAVMLSMDGHSRSEPAAAATEAPAPPKPVRRARPPPEPAAETAPPASAATPEIDPQVAEDAAAAGMTSRRTRP